MHGQPISNEIMCFVYVVFKSTTIIYTKSINCISFVLETEGLYCDVKKWIYFFYLRDCHASYRSRNLSPFWDCNN